MSLAAIERTIAANSVPTAPIGAVTTSKRAGVRPLAHLGEIAVPEPGEADRVLAHGIADRGTHDVGALGVGERRKFLPAIAEQQFELFRRPRPFLCRPEDVGSQPDRFAARNIGSDLIGDVMAADLGKRPSFKQ